MNPRHSPAHRQRPARHQRGAVALVLCLMLLLLFGIIGLALDLSQLYLRKTELQNAADAAALAGARKLDGSGAGVANALAQAKATALQNQFAIVKDLALPDSAVRFGHNPDQADETWQSAATAQATPCCVRFIKIDTNGVSVGKAAVGEVTFSFITALAPTLASGTTFGRAVAGRFSWSHPVALFQ